MSADSTQPSWSTTAGNWPPENLPSTSWPHQDQDVGAGTRATTVQLPSTVLCIASPVACTLRFKTSPRPMPLKPGEQKRKCGCRCDIRVGKGTAEEEERGASFLVWMLWVLVIGWASFVFLKIYGQ